MNLLKRKKRLTSDEYAKGISVGDRILLSKAITLAESSRVDDEPLAQEVLAKVMPKTGNSVRIGITGPPGVGKSTFIEAFGEYLISQGHKIAVLAIDPSSQIHRGSIMGDKTRMESLSHHPKAYIRPSAAGSHIGGVGRKTREAMLLCEAAGYDVILIETVGVGQSEVAVRNMTDFFLLLSLAGAGDELQGIKKGIMEMADLIAITKADKDNIALARKAKVENSNALRLFPPKDNGWQPTVITCSALEKRGLDQIWEKISGFKRQATDSGSYHANRQDQNKSWMQEAITDGLLKRFLADKEVKGQIRLLEEKVTLAQIPPYAAAKSLLDSFFKKESTC